MSCYNWEEGTITIPKKEWSKFRTGLLKAWNEGQLATLEKAKKAHKQLSEAIKGKRGANRSRALEEAVERRFTRAERPGSCFREAVDQDVRNLIVEDWPVKLRAAPKKKDLDIFPVTKSATIRAEDFTVVFNNEECQVSWFVSENNRAVEAAREHWFAKKLFSALRRIKWTRGTGGKIIGNDEYNRDSYEAGGGGNYVTEEFSAEADKRRAEAKKIYSQMTRSGYRFGGRW